MATNPSSGHKEVEIVINKDGTLSVDQIGWEGKACDGSIEDLVRLLGREVKTDRKAEWYKKQKVHINQKAGG